MVNGVTTTHPAYFMHSPLASELALQGEAEVPLTIGKSEASDLPDADLQQRSQGAEDALLAYEKKKALKSKQEEGVKPEDLVLKPSEVPFEERLKQVVSLETIQTLLLLRSPYEKAKDEAQAAAKPIGKTIDKRG